VADGIAGRRGGAAPSGSSPSTRTASVAAPRRSLWRDLWDSAGSDRISLVAAGCAFYGMLALFPALSLLISTYGIWFDPATVEPQLEVLEQLLPGTGYDLIEERVRHLVTTPRETLGIGALASALIALWSASAGIRALLSALNLAHGGAERRGALAFYGTALLFTLGGIMAVTIGLGFLVGLPAALDAFGLPPARALALRGVSLLLLLVFVQVAIAMLYRFGPARPPPGWRLLSPGALLATFVWAIASAAFSLYVSNFGSYDATYGALGAAVALLTWFYVSVYLILLGAELNAALDARRGGAQPRRAGDSHNADQPQDDQDRDGYPEQPEQHRAHRRLLDGLSVENAGEAASLPARGTGVRAAR
jgi:membrane protein